MKNNYELNKSSHDQNIQKQFDLRSSTFDQSAKWIQDKNLLNAHVKIAGKSIGRALELCCGTGTVGLQLQKAGWDVVGVDVSEGMVRYASRFFPTMQASASKLPFKNYSFDLIAMRQALFLVDDQQAVLKEAKRLLNTNGKLLISHLVPFGTLDSEYLKKIHLVKQAQLRVFYTIDSLIHEIECAGFEVVNQEAVVVRESVSLWMSQAPELSEYTRNQVCQMVLNSPLEYQNCHQVEIVNNEIFENWNFILLSAKVK
jgi:ubiquinone/menaquinone biosynthesis C-methylase UbiE